MAYVVPWHGANTTLGHPDKVKYTDMPAFDNGYMIVTCWELSNTDILNLIEQHKAGKPYHLYVCVQTEMQSIKPMAIGTEAYIKSYVADTGKVWKNG